MYTALFLPEASLRAPAYIINIIFFFLGKGHCVLIQEVQARDIYHIDILCVRIKNSEYEEPSSYTPRIFLQYFLLYFIV
jgi:hypothetical protein